MGLHQIVLFFFWTCMIVLLYSYIGYGILVWSMVQAKYFLYSRKENDNHLLSHSSLPSIAVIIAAFNEEECIEEKINNTLALVYPKDMLSVHIVTDGSSDNTTSICRGFTNINSYHQDKREGKVAAIQRILPGIDADILLFTDANCRLEENALELIVPYFKDQRIGGVSGEKKVAGSSVKAEATEGLYWKYESWLKYLDARLNTVVGAAGELLVLRKTLYHYLPEDTILDDFMQSMLVCAKGYRIAYEPGAAAIEPPSLSLADEMERKTRIAAGAFQSMQRLKKIKEIWKQPLLAFQYISHRILRWTVAPLSLPVLFILNLILCFLTSSSLYLAVFIMQCCFYGAALAGYMYYNKARRSPGLLRIPLYFAMMNIAIYKGYFRYKKNGQTMLWKKAPRNSSISGNWLPHKKVP